MSVSLARSGVLLEVAWYGHVRRTVAGDVLDEDLHPVLSVGGGRRDAGDAVGTHLEQLECVQVC